MRTCKEPHQVGKSRQHPAPRTAFAFAATSGVEGNSWAAYISGTQAFSNEVLIDGTLAQESETGQELESEPPMEAVEEFRVDSGGIDTATGI
jgi:hypothetical protein